ncbi:hypothetical protein Tco_0330179, partial [Tanacetum coccineum]
SETAVPTGPSFGFSADPVNKGKSPMVAEDPPINQRSFRQLEEDRLGAEAAKKLYEEEQAEQEVKASSGSSLDLGLVASNGVVADLTFPISNFVGSLDHSMD